MLSNKDFDHQFGPALVLDYSFKHLPISIQAGTRFYITLISSHSNSTENTNHHISIGASINYFPVVSETEPYIGLGAFYNFNNVEGVGNESGNTFLSLPKGNISAEIIGGVKFFADKSFSLILEAAQTLNNTGSISTFDAETYKVIKKEDISLNSFFIKVGVLFRI